MSGECHITGPYYPVGDVDWECRKHGEIALLRDPTRYGASDLRREDFVCPQDTAGKSTPHFTVKSDGRLVQNVNVGPDLRQEWGVMRRGREWEGLARGPWAKETCEDFVRECINEGIPAGVFYVVSRHVTKWSAP